MATHHPNTIAPTDESHRQWLAFLRSELIAPTEALEQKTGQLVLAMNSNSGLAKSVLRIAIRAKELRARVTAVVDRPTGDPLDKRVLRHDLRGAVGYILSACEDLAETTTQGQEVLQETLELARKVLGLVESVVTYSPESAADSTVIRQSYDRIRRQVNRARPGRAEPGRILLVDDNEFQRELIAQILTDQGHAVEIASGGNEAKQYLVENPDRIDVILCDLIMPGVTGLDLLLWLKSEPELWSIPTIMISALEDESGVLACIAAGAEDYLARPVKAEFLRARIAGSLEKKRLQTRIDRLVRAMFPPAIVTEWQTTGTVLPKRHEHVGVLFADVVGFTSWCETRREQPESVVDRLQDLFIQFERTAMEYGVQKIKTIGDAFMAVAGLSDLSSTPALSLLKFGHAIIATTREHPLGWQVRVGVHVGPVVSGILGQTQFSFDVWGHTVNLASRMESNGKSGFVTLSDEAWREVQSQYDSFTAQPRTVEVKGLGKVTVWDCAK